MRVMKGERGNIGIFILTHLLVAILVGFFLWSIFPEPWREFLRNGPWGIVVVVLAGFIIVVSIVRESGRVANTSALTTGSRKSSGRRPTLRCKSARPFGSSIKTGTTRNG